jgi:hypothetical protein
METLQPGPAGEPLPSGEWVLRLAVASKDFLETGQVSPEVFALSTEDRRDDPPRLSVWAERLTRPDQAWHLLGEKPHYRLSLRLSVDAIRALRPHPDSPEALSLDVQWHPLLTADRAPDPRPGAAGHSGITGLEAGASAQRKSWRRKLAQLGGADARWIAHELPATEEHLRGPHP